jgi:molecular chaperone HscB
MQQQREFRADAGPVAGPLGTCWSCKGPADGAALFCPTCGAVQPPGQVDHFGRLGLSVAFDIDPSALDRRYFDCQRLLHPDRFATRTTRERALSQSQAISINEAYATLKDPLKRADYLVHLKGSGVLSEGCNLVNDQELLTESLELREALADAETPDDVDALARRASADVEGCLRALSEVFAADDLEGACRLTTRLKYLRKLVDECRLRRGRLTGGE